MLENTLNGPYQTQLRTFGQFMKNLLQKLPSFSMNLTKLKWMSKYISKEVFNIIDLIYLLLTTISIALRVISIIYNTQKPFSTITLSLLVNLF